MVVLGVLGKYHCVCIVVIDLRYMLNLLRDYPVPDKSNPLSVLLDSYNFSYFPTLGAQDLWLSDQDYPSVSYGIGKSFSLLATIVAGVRYNFVHLWFFADNS